MSRAGKSYTIKISGKSGDTDVNLQPATEPFITSEEGNEDLFVPVKTQTGYINIITEDVSLIQDIIPETGGTRSVILRQGNKIKWMGYVQPQLLSMDMWQGKIKVGIPVECPLSALRYTKYQQPQDTISICRAIDYILTSSISYEFCIFQSPMINNEDYSLLLKRFYTVLFKDDNYTNYEALEAICTFFGFTARVFATDVYFIKMRNVDSILGRELQEMQGIDMYSDDVVSANETQWSEIEILSSMVADNKTKLIFYEGIKSASVECKLDLWSVKLTSPNDPIKEAIDQGTINPTLYTFIWQNMAKMGYYQSFGPVTVGDWSVVGYNVSAELDKGGSIDVSDWKYKMSLYGSARNYDENTQSPSLNYNWEITEWYEGYLRFTYNTQMNFTVPGNLKINLNATNITEDFKIKCTIGTYDTGYIPATDKVGEYLVHIPGGTQGTLVLKLEFKAPLSHWYLMALPVDNPDMDLSVKDLSGFSIEFESDQDSVINSNRNSVVFTKENDKKYKDKKDIETDLCLKKQYIQNAKNLLLNYDDTFCEALIIDGNGRQIDPMESLATEIINECSSIGKMVTHTIRTDSLNYDITPTTVIISDDLDAVFYPASIENDWEDDTVKLKLIERKYEDIY